MKIKKTKFQKRLISLWLVLFLCIENFAAVVSDNDGSAFITKAEFDSLKNDFQSQIDQYNISIDSKIDGAIAAYLAGIKVDNKTTENDLNDESEYEEQDIIQNETYDISLNSNQINGKSKILSEKDYVLEISFSF